MPPGSAGGLGHGQVLSPHSVTPPSRSGARGRAGAGKAAELPASVVAVGRTPKKLPTPAEQAEREEEKAYRAGKARRSLGGPLDRTGAVLQHAPSGTPGRRARSRARVFAASPLSATPPGQRDGGESRDSRFSPAPSSRPPGITPGAKPLLESPDEQFVLIVSLVPSPFCDIGCFDEPRTAAPLPAAPVGGPRGTVPPPVLPSG